MKVERAIEILNPEHREHYESIDPVNEACRMGMEALERARWIPCSERLPENAMNVIAQFSDGTVTELRYAGNGIFEGIYEYSTRVIIAWMPLPEPYEGE